MGKKEVVQVCITVTHAKCKGTHLTILTFSY